MKSFFDLVATGRRSVFCLVWAMGVLRSLESGAAESTPFREALVIESTGRAGRNTLFTDAIAARVVAGTWQQPMDGEEVELPDGQRRRWMLSRAGEDGWFTGRAMRGGYAYVGFPAEVARVAVLNASGHSMAYVNGEPRAGDVYSYGYVSVPVLLRPGTNDFLFAAGRGRLRAQLLEPRAPVYIHREDPTLPDFRVGSGGDAWAAVVLVNATTQWVAGGEIVARLDRRATSTKVPSIPPLGLRKVAFMLRNPGRAGAGEMSVQLQLRNVGGHRGVLDEWVTPIRVRTQEQAYKRTFISEIDGSVQYFAVQPGRELASGSKPALVLSLHGASVEAIGQAEAYAPKRWSHIVCPTNRRPYGFDWEEWGRMDALEVLAIASREFGIDPDRVYLTGHSMGGHGTWSLGATVPDRFAAVAPSAGWISFFSYAGTDSYTNATPVEAVLRRAAASSDTLALATNYLQHGVYVLHGDADDNVPVREARTMRGVLGGFHRDVDWHEQPGAGHWWENSDEPGAECVDWPPMFDFFARHRRPADLEVRRLQFVTVNPAVSAESRWARIEHQEELMTPSAIDLQWDPGVRRVRGTTRNVRRLSLDLSKLQVGTQPIEVDLDGVSLGKFHPAESGISPQRSRRRGAMDPAARTHFLRDEGRWAAVSEGPATWKSPRRGGPFKQAFQHRMIFVYGTRGTADENAWAFAKARMDGEAFWYRGNGSIEILPDSAFEPALYPDRGVVLYGHADMNAAWARLLGDSPVQVRRGEVRVGERAVARPDVACLFLRPRPDSEVASVAVISGTGMAGLRMCDRLPYFMAGTAYPDYLVVGTDALARGNRGIVTAGFFGNDWSLADGASAWSDDAP
ncbi:MAG: prolyl oligopeptidase family serine peptidase [Verrucomicrobiales bacterium]|nr:prolyl oligopeptidase family serine peptidase [Verrucomicrobiales bacterium]